MSVEKYMIARKFRRGAASCMNGEGLDPLSAPHFKAGWKWAYSELRPILNDKCQEYIVALGHDPFQLLEAMRLEKEP